MSGPLDVAAVHGFDLQAMVSALGGAEDASWDWLQASYADPDGFWRALWARAEAASEVPLTSELGARYDLFQAVCGRFQGARPALQAMSWPREHGGFLQTDYALLAHHAALSHSYWVSLGIQPGASVCIISQPGPELALALAAGLRAGLVISVVPPVRRSFVRNRVRALQPDHVIVDRQFSPWLGSYAERALRLMDSSARLPGVVPDSHTYAADDPVLRAFAPYSHDTLTARDLSAHELFTGLLRDAQLIWPVMRGERVAAFGETALLQPMALLTTWFGGGEFLFLDHQLLRKRPRQLVGHSPNLWFLDCQARDLLLEGTLLEELTIDRWFRDPAEPTELAPWQELSARLAAKGALGANLLQASACGGCLLFSARAPSPALFEVRPAPGRPWQLEDLNGSGEPAIGAAGVYAPADSCQDGRAGRFVLSRIDDVYRLSGALDTWHAGLCYPLEEVRRLLIKRAQADHVAAVMVPKSTRMHDADALLVVFVDPRWGDALEAHSARWRRDILTLIEEELGPASLPDQLYLVPLLAKQDEAGLVDADWARREVLGNVLFHKAHRPVFVEVAALTRTLTLLAEALQAATDPAPGATA
jgi:hypothetical protein